MDLPYCLKLRSLEDIVGKIFCQGGSWKTAAKSVQKEPPSVAAAVSFTDEQQYKGISVTRTRKNECRGDYCSSSKVSSSASCCTGRTCSTTKSDYDELSLDTTLLYFKLSSATEWEYVEDCDDDRMMGGRKRIRNHIEQGGREENEEDKSSLNSDSDEDSISSLEPKISPRLYMVQQMLNEGRRERQHSEVEERSYNSRSMYNNRSYKNRTTNKQGKYNQKKYQSHPTVICSAGQVKHLNLRGTKSRIR